MRDNGEDQRKGKFLLFIAGLVLGSISGVLVGGFILVIWYF